MRGIHSNYLRLGDLRRRSEDIEDISYFMYNIVRI